MNFIISTMELKCIEIEEVAFRQNMLLNEKNRERKRKHRNELKKLIAEKTAQEHHAKAVYNELTERMMKLQIMAVGKIEVNNIEYICIICVI